MTNNNNNKENKMRKFNAIKNAVNFGKGKKMSEPNGYRFRVYKFNKNTYTAFANFQKLYDGVDYMRRWNPNQMHNWYIVDEDTGQKFEMNREGDMLVMA